VRDILPAEHGGQMVRARGGTDVSKGAVEGRCCLITHALL